MQRVDAAERPRPPRPARRSTGDVLEHAAEARDERVAVEAVGCVDVDALRPDRREAIACGRVSVTVIEGCAIATVDADRREYADGHIVCADGRIAAVGPGPAPRRAGRRAPDRRARHARHARPGQLPPPPLPARHARLRAAGDAVRVARRALPGVAAHRRRRRRRRGARRAGAARPLGLQHHDRPPLHLPPPRRRPARGGDRRRARDRPALPPLPRRDGPRARATAACRPTASSRTATRSSPRAPRRSTASTIPRRARWCGSRSPPRRPSRSPAS